MKTTTNFESERPVQQIVDIVLQSDLLKEQNMIISSIVELNAENFDSVYEMVRNYMRENVDDTRLIFDVIVRVSIVREKNMKLLVKLVKLLVGEFQSHYENTKILETISTAPFLKEYMMPMNIRFMKLLIKHGIIPCYSINEMKIDETEDFLIDGLNENTLEYYIKYDMFKEVQDCASQPLFDYEQKIDENNSAFYKLCLTDKDSELFQTLTYEFTPLSYACFNGSIKCFKFFVLNSSEIDSLCTFYAIHGGNSEIIHYLDQKEFEFQPQCFEYAVLNYRNDIADWILNHFTSRIPSANAVLAAYNLSAYFFVIDNTYIIQQTQLLSLTQRKSLPMSAVKQEQPIIEDAYETKIATINLCCRMGLTSVLTCFYDTDLAGELKSKSSQRNLLKIMNDMIVSACSSGCFSAVSFITNKFKDFIGNIAKNESKNTKIRQALYAATVSLSTKIVEHIISLGFDVDSIQKFDNNPDDFNWYSFACNEFMNPERERFSTPLCAAAILQSDKIAEILLNNGAEPDLCESNKRSPFILASLGSNLELVKALEKANCSVELCDMTEFNALHYASIGGHIPIIKHMLTHGFDINALNKYKQGTPLHLACQYGHFEAAKFLIENGAAINMYGPSLNDGDLYYASISGNADIVELLINHGANLETKTFYSLRRKSDTTPLMAAVVRDLIKPATVLANYGADVNTRMAEKQNTALHVACLHNNVKMVSMLLAHGADTDTVNEDGQKPIELTTSKEIRKLLYEEHK